MYHLQLFTLNLTLTCIAVLGCQTNVEVHLRYYWCLKGQVLPSIFNWQTKLGQCNCHMLPSIWQYGKLARSQGSKCAAIYIHLRNLVRMMQLPYAAIYIHMRN